jgi:hypothetical protein
MFCAPELVFSDIEGVGSRFHVLRSLTPFRWYRWRRVLLSCFALPDPFSLVRSSSGPVSCFALPDLFLAVPSVSGPVFMFWALVLIFGGTERVGSRFHVLRYKTNFRRYRGRRVLFSCYALRDHFWRYRRRLFLFSCFALPNPFFAVPTTSGPVFMFCVPGLIFGGSEGVRSSFHVLRSWTRFWRYRGVGSRYHVLRSLTRFRRF